MRYGRLAITSAVMFVCAATLETTLHEGAHFVAGLALGRGPELHHNFVSFADEDSAAMSTRIITAAAGPLFSLVLGLLAHLRLRMRVADPFARLFTWQFAVAGYIGCFGYMLIAPFFAYGDTGFVLRALGAPMWLMVVVAIAGFGAIFVVTRMLAPYVVSLMSSETAADAKTRGPFVAAVVVNALLVGIPIFTMLNLPVPTFLSLLAPLMSPWGVVYAYGSYLHAPPSENGDERVAGRMPVAWYVVLVLLVAVNRVLVRGVG